MEDLHLHQTKILTYPDESLQRQAERVKALMRQHSDLLKEGLTEKVEAIAKEADQISFQLAEYWMDRHSGRFKIFELPIRADQDGTLPMEEIKVDVDEILEENRTLGHELFFTRPHLVGLNNATKLPIQQFAILFGYDTPLKFDVQINDMKVIRPPPKFFKFIYDLGLTCGAASYLYSVQDVSGRYPAARPLGFSPDDSGLFWKSTIRLPRANWLANSTSRSQRTESTENADENRNDLSHSDLIRYSHLMRIPVSTPSDKDLHFNGLSWVPKNKS